MKATKIILAVLAFAVMLGGAGLLLRLKTMQRLGEPGVKAQPVAGSPRMDIYLPERVLGWTSSNLPPSELELKMLPQDTSLVRRHYRAPDGFEAVLGVVMMGTDRTSIHKPEYCLTSQGWSIVGRETTSLKMDRPQPYVLPLRLFTTAVMVEDPSGRPVRWSGLFAFWFVAENRLTASHWTRMGWITWELLRRGVLPRWAYITCLTTCPPGQEELALARMKEFLAAAVPEFQKVGPEGLPVTTAPAP